MIFLKSFNPLTDLQFPKARRQNCHQLIKKRKNKNKSQSQIRQAIELFEISKEHLKFHWMQCHCEKFTLISFLF